MDNETSVSAPPSPEDGITLKLLELLRTLKNQKTKGDTLNNDLNKAGIKVRNFKSFYKSQFTTLPIEIASKPGAAEKVLSKRLKNKPIIETNAKVLPSATALPVNIPVNEPTYELYKEIRGPIERFADFLGARKPYMKAMVISRRTISPGKEETETRWERIAKDAVPFDITTKWNGFLHSYRFARLQQVGTTYIKFDPYYAPTVCDDAGPEDPSASGIGDSTPEQCFADIEEPTLASAIEGGKSWEKLVAMGLMVVVIIASLVVAYIALSEPPSKNGDVTPPGNVQPLKPNVP